VRFRVQVLIDLQYEVLGGAAEMHEATMHIAVLPHSRMYEIALKVILPLYLSDAHTTFFPHMLHLIGDFKDARD